MQGSASSPGLLAAVQQCWSITNPDKQDTAASIFHTVLILQFEKSSAPFLHQCHLKRILEYVEAGFGNLQQNLFFQNG
ncbi:hypothetical protein HHUSO_G24078 [Huso huso]|uniref:Uncharacterized protein n=1 Tax=Huso huso TaxID=61971 RepID=A0ABR0YTY5_HUSHU